MFAGCATGPTSTGAYYDPNKPQTFLAGAEVEQAKAVAMGSAVSKGWKITKSTDNRLVVQRRLNAAAAETVVEGASLTQAPSLVEVQTDFFERDQGVDVVLKASVISNMGTEEEKRQDFTESYRDDLLRSLTSLRMAWEESRWRVASATPPLPSPGPTPGESDAENRSSLEEGEPVAESGWATQPASGVGTAWQDNPSPAPAPAGPVETASTEPTPSPVSTSASTQPAAYTPPDPAENMLVLNEPSDTGVWAYYAEHYARVRGCQLAGGGALLLEKKPEYEMHRVYCEGGQTYLVKCNAGSCRGAE